jgi:DNA polymerase-1
MIDLRKRQAIAINTPVQGGAADIMIAAMIKIHDNQELRKMGWKILM